MSYPGFCYCNINLITLKLLLLHAIVHICLKIPIKPLFYRIFIRINTVRVKKMGVQFFAHHVCKFSLTINWPRHERLN